MPVVIGNEHGWKTVLCFKCFDDKIFLFPFLVSTLLNNENVNSSDKGAGGEGK